MLVLSLMASSGNVAGLAMYQEQSMCRSFKDFQPLLPIPRSRQEITRSGICTLTLYEQDNLFRSMGALYGYSQFVKNGFIRRKPLLVDLQDVHADPVLFRFAIDEQWTKHKRILQFLMSRSSDIKEDYLDRSVLSDLMGLQAIPADMDLPHFVSTEFESSHCFGEEASLLHPNMNSYDQKADCDRIYDLPSSTISVHPDGRPSYISTMTDMKKLVSVLAQFSLTKDSAGWRKQKVLVPYFRWNDVIEVQDDMYPSALKLQTLTASPLKSPEKVKLKPGPKRKSKKARMERDLYKNNSLHAWESLLSLMMDNKRNGKLVMNSLKKSSPELPRLLTQFSASIAGTGLAVIFSVLYKLACGSTLISITNLLTSGFGVGLFCLSWTVNKLRNTIIHISKNSAKLGFQEEEMMRRVDNSVNDILFRAAGLMVLIMLMIS